MTGVPDNLRVHVMRASLKTVGENLGGDPGNALEVGCMFSLDEGCSTALIAQALGAWGRGGRLLSIEGDERHIQQARSLLGRLDAALPDRVTFHHGMSYACLEEVLQKTGPVSFVSLDGGGAPEVSLLELELVIPQLTRGGLIFMDDLSELPQTSSYRQSRLFGKGNLVLPLLLLAGYVTQRLAERKRPVSSPLLKAISGWPLDLFAQVDFRLVTQGCSRVMVLGAAPVVAHFQRNLLEGGEPAGPEGFRPPSSRWVLRDPFGWSEQNREIPLERLAPGVADWKVWFRLGLTARHVPHAPWRSFCQAALVRLEADDRLGGALHYHRGSLLEVLGRTSEARDAFGRFLKEAPDDHRAAGAWYHLGRMEAGAGNRASARRCFEACLERNPQHRLARRSLREEWPEPQGGCADEP